MDVPERQQAAQQGVLQSYNTSCGASVAHLQAFGSIGRSRARPVSAIPRAR
jgi:hypothetical protein